jgi:hypothetical protein
VFGHSAPGNQEERQKLDVTIDTVEAYDQDVVVHSGDTAFSLFQGSGFYTTVTPSIDFSSTRERFQIGISAGSNARYYGDLHETVLANHSVGAGLMVHLSPDTSVSFNQGVTYAPGLLYGLFASVTVPTLGSAVPAASNYKLNNESFYSSASTASLTHRLARRTTAEFTADLKFTTFTAQNTSYPDMRTEGVGGRLLYSLSRGVALRVGYGYRQANYVGSPRSTQQNLDIGLEYTRNLSRTRKATWAFSVGPTKANAPLLIGSPDVRQQYRVVADASLTYEMGRTWRLQGTFHRGLGYIEGLQGPVFTEAYAASSTGYLNRRTDFSITAAYSTGESALTGTPSEFATYTGDARLRYAVTRNWATYIEYLYYYYNFNRALLPPGLPPGLTRNGVRTGVTLWIPTMRH